MKTLHIDHHASSEHYPIGASPHVVMNIDDNISIAAFTNMPIRTKITLEGSDSVGSGGFLKKRIRPVGVAIVISLVTIFLIVRYTQESHGSLSKFPSTRTVSFAMPRESVTSDTYSCVAFDMNKVGIEDEASSSLVVKDIVGATPRPSDVELVHHMSLYLCDGVEKNVPFRTRYSCHDTIQCLGRSILAFGFEHMSASIAPTNATVYLPYGVRYHVTKVVVLQVHNNKRIENDESSFQVVVSNSEGSDRVNDDGDDKLAFDVFLDANRDNGIPPSQSSFEVISRTIAPLRGTFNVYELHFHHHSLCVQSVLVVRRENHDRYTFTAHAQGNVSATMVSSPKDDEASVVSLRNVWDEPSLHPNTFRLRRDDVIDVRPGDEWILSCVYDTSSRDDATAFGFRSVDEMCQCYLKSYTTNGIQSVRWSQQLGLLP